MKDLIMASILKENINYGILDIIFCIRQRVMLYFDIIFNHKNCMTLM